MTAPVGVTFLGGLGEVGLNCTVIEVDGKLLVIDFGLMFAEADMPGVNALYPDTKWLASRSEDVVGLIVTHGHEDHVGGVPQFAADIGAPIFGSAFTIALAEHKLTKTRLPSASSGLAKPTTHVLADGERRHIGPFDVEVIPITHSVPQSLCVIVHTPQGVLVHTGDFKIDPTPVDGRLTDLDRLTQLSADPGVRLLMADSTNADSPGHTPSETEIGDTFRRLFPGFSGRRLIVSCFASHLHRIQQVIDVASEQGRFVVPLGRTMENNIRIARKLGILKVSDNRLKPAAALGDLNPGEVCVVCTGAQGESQAALSLMANGTHPAVRITSNDAVILSSHPIPGNEKAVFAVINKLCALGAQVVHDGNEPVHTSGHARRDDLKQLHLAVRPEWFVPIEGEFHMLTRHAQLAREIASETGLKPERALVLTDGEQLRIDDQGVTLADKLDVAPVMLDGANRPVSADLVAQRLQLGKAGLIHITVVVSGAGELVGSPEIVSRGWLDFTDTNSAKLQGELQNQVERVAKKELAEIIKGFRSSRNPKRSGRNRGARKSSAASKANPAKVSATGLANHIAADTSVASLKRKIRRAAGRFVGERTRLSAAIEVSVLTVSQPR